MKTPADLAAIRVAKKHLVASRHDNLNAVRVTVGMGTCGIAAGARAVSNAFVEEIFKAALMRRRLWFCPAAWAIVLSNPWLPLRYPAPRRLPM